MRFIAFIVTFFLLPFASSGILAKEKEKEKMFTEIDVPQKMVECLSKIPPLISEVHFVALKYARLSPDDISRWKKNIKWSALLPRLQFGYQRRVRDGVSVDIDDSVSVTSSGVTIGPTASEWGQNLDRNNDIEVKAIWYLDELLFNREDLSISSEARSQISSRADLLGRVTDDYFELKRLLSIYLTKGRTAERIMGRLHMEIDRLVGRLDALTGGWFGSRFKWREFRCD